jgi:hypothetical protein
MLNFFKKFLSKIGFGEPAKSKVEGKPSVDKSKIQLFPVNSFMSNITINETGVYIKGKKIEPGVYKDAIVIAKPGGGYSITSSDGNSISVEG